MNPIFVSATIDIGSGLIKEVADLILDCQSESAAKQKFYIFLKNTLPSWQKVGKISVL